MDGRLVAIKIIPRLSKTRRLGKVSAIDPQQNTKREIAILKKIRHENVVALLEVIDDPELQKIYMVLEHVERGEVTWRKKGLPNICYFERYRFEKGVHGKELAPGECNWHAVLDRKATIRALKESRTSGLPPPVNEWTTKYGVTADNDDQMPWWYVPSAGLGPDTSLLDSHSMSRGTSRVPSRVASTTSVSSLPTPQSFSTDESPPSAVAQDGDSGSETPGLLQLNQMASTALDGNMLGAYIDETVRLRQRSPSVADSIMSHVSGLDFNSMVHDPYADDFSYVPCFSIEQARSAFRDTVLGLEYLHYHGVVHRDIKPANLLWTRSFRVKISDFGVSYFGRPIRDGETDGAISEAEARDFDDDRELSRTVGTPAFFAPELCYTDVDKEPPRVSEQIDVWSLGVTLYCLIYARIPFLAEDEFAMFRKIATEEPFISKTRLKPVGVFTDPTGASLYQRVNVHPYRNDADPEYEELSDALLDLLRKMLVKNPEKRIRLRDIKRHPWVTEDIDNVDEWLERTDPARSQDRRIQVDDAEIGGAVVPLNFLQRARSAMKRAVGKVIHPRGDREESMAASSRHRASSSAASSVVDLPALSESTGVLSPPHLDNNSASSSINHQGQSHDRGHGHIHSLGHIHTLGLGHSYSQGNNHPFTNHLSLHGISGNHHRDARRKSLRGDDYFATVTQMPTEHPLAHSVSASPFDSPGSSTPNPESAQQLMFAGELAAGPLPETPIAYGGGVFNVDGSGEASLATVSRPINRHVHSRSVTNALLSRASILGDIQTLPPTPSPATIDSDSASTIRHTREVRASTVGSSRAQSVDRAGIVFASPDKRAAPVVGIKTAIALGSVQQPWPTLQDALLSHLVRSEADGNTGDVAAALLDERPATAHRVQEIASMEAGTIGRNKSNSLSALPSTSMSIGPQAEPCGAMQQLVADPSSVPCPPSPRPIGATRPEEPKPCTAEAQAASKVKPVLTTASSSSVSLGGTNPTPLTSPSDRTHHSSTTGQPGHRKGSSTAMMTFQSDPSLPALLSGASSVSADMEGDFLGSPGVVGDPSLDVSDSLTPPALEKEAAGFPLDQNQDQQLKDQQGWGSAGVIPVELDNKTRTPPISTPVRSNSRNITDDDDSDSDGGIVMMAKAKKKGHGFSRESMPLAEGGRSQPHSARRRDTNTSIGSTDTAKKVSVNES